MAGIDVAASVMLASMRDHACLEVLERNILVDSVAYGSILTSIILCVETISFLSSSFRG